MLSIGGKAEKIATDNLREVIDRCREELPGALFMYAVPPDFLHTIVPKYPALQQRVQAVSYFSRSNPFSPQINLEHLDLPDEQLLEEIGYRLLPIFDLAYGGNWMLMCKAKTSLYFPMLPDVPTSQLAIDACL
jgi:hypothetical protein